MTAAESISTIKQVEEDHDTTSTEYTSIQVVLNRPFFQTFDYKLKGVYGKEICGCRVAITFGNAKAIGIIVDNHSSTSATLYKIKEATLLDQKPLLPYDIMEVMRFGSHYYKYPLGQALYLALPALLRSGAPAEYKQQPGLRSLVADNDLEETCQHIKNLQQRSLLSELQKGPRSRHELRDQGYSSAVERQLLNKGLVELIDMAQDCRPFDLEDALARQDLLLSAPLPLNEEQTKALNAINTHDNFGVFLLNGVTGSGKTEVYLQAIEHTLSKGESALILIPEISLTPQTLKRFYTRFKVPIATSHSSLNDRERLDAFLDMYNRKAIILIGTRSALFTPIPNLGLIIIDEEHDSSFKQDDTFRYHARTLAIYRAQLNNCKLILGSATPSLETLYNVQQGFIKELLLLHRARTTHMPTIMLNDLSKEPLLPSLKSGISTPLDEAIGICTAQHHQALLFLNRRGSAHHMQCHHCGKVISCQYCANSMTVHKGIHMLHCHVCNTKIPIPTKCPYCGSEALIETGIGTEQIENYLRLRFPDVGIERIDRDTIANREQLDAALNNILNHKGEILVGTQMLAKGHDFPDVTLVGILDTDAGLISDNFQALETTAQLITQVAGRAGRAKTPGQVLIQSRYCHHALLQDLVSPDACYRDIAYKLLEQRKALLQPPYSQQAVVMASSKQRDRAFNYLSEIFDKISEDIQGSDTISISPVLPDRMEKRVNRYYFNFVITAQKPEELSQYLDKIVDFSSKNSITGDIRFAIDVDPLELP